MDQPYISKIRIYPVKSLDPIEVQKAEMGIRSLLHDRAFAMVAEDGRYVNGKRTGMVNQLKAEYDLANQTISLGLRTGGPIDTFELREGNADLDKYLSDFFDINLAVYHRTKGELMDIPGASSITIVSEASLQSLHQDFTNNGLENLRLRFRSNIELGGTTAFWEENLFEKPDMGVRFLVGDVEMIGISPRARCNVPPKDPLTGETDKSFVKAMMESRANSLPHDSTLPLFGGNYHLTVNVFLPDGQQEKSIAVGDTIRILESVKLGM